MNAALWNRILEFNDKWFPKWRSTEPIYYSNALAGEVGPFDPRFKEKAQLVLA